MSYINVENHNFFYKHDEAELFFWPSNHFWLPGKPFRVLKIPQSYLHKFASTECFSRYQVYVFCHLFYNWKDKQIKWCIKGETYFLNFSLNKVWMKPLCQFHHEMAVSKIMLKVSVSLFFKINLIGNSHTWKSTEENVLV